MTSIYKNIVLKNLQKHYNRIFNGNMKTPLGRWELLYDHRMQKRIDRANEDHCGPCGSTYNANDYKNTTNSK